MSKKPQTTHPRAFKASSVFGTLGYFSVLLQWTWTLLVLCYPLLMADHGFLLPNKPAHPASTMPGGMVSSPIVVIVALAVTAFILVLTVMILIRLPKTIGLRGAKITHKTARLVVPIMTKHAPLPKKKVLTLSYRVILIVKILLVTTPLLGLLFTPAETPLSGLVIWSLAIFCVSWSILYFALQQLIGYIFKIQLDKLW